MWNRKTKWNADIKTNYCQVQTNVAYAADTNKYLLYVHGWNIADEEKMCDGKTVFKRLWWQGYTNGYGTFDWPTLYGVKEWKLFLPVSPWRMNFDDSEMIAWLSATALSKLMEDLNPSGELRVLAHSQGNTVVGEALRKYDGKQKIHAYIAAQAAIGGSLYSSQPDPHEEFNWFYPLNTPNIMAYWPNGTNNGAEPYFVTNSSKVVNMCNYYNLNDFALHTAWERNNRWKPDDAIGWGYAYGGLTNFYDETVNKTNRFYRYGGLTQLDIDGLEITNTVGDIRERYEVFSYCAESWLKALGQGSNTAFGVNRDLGDVPLKYDQYHYSHSREFRSNITKERAFFEYIMNDGNF